MNLSQEHVRNILFYDSETGEFRWRWSRLKPKIGKRAGHQHRRGHWEIEIGGRAYLLHRIAWLHFYGHPIPEMIDHRDRNKSNNAISNLRAATNGQNRANSKTTAKSGFKGVSIDKRRSKSPWRAQITANKKRRVLGYFNTPEEAHEAYCAAAREAFGEFFHSDNH